MKISLWKCPHCNMTYEKDEDYKEHLKTVVGGNVKTINNLMLDMREFHMGVEIVYEGIHNRRTVVLHDNGEKII